MYANHPDIAKRWQAEFGSEPQPMFKAPISPAGDSMKTTRAPKQFKAMRTGGQTGKGHLGFTPGALAKSMLKGTKR